MVGLVVVVGIFLRGFRAFSFYVVNEWKLSLFPF